MIQKLAACLPNSALLRAFIVRKMVALRWIIFPGKLILVLKTRFRDIKDIKSLLLYLLKICVSKFLPNLAQNRQFWDDFWAFQNSLFVGFDRPTAFLVPKPPKKWSFFKIGHFWRFYPQNAVDLPNSPKLRWFICPYRGGAKCSKLWYFATKKIAQFVRFWPRPSVCKVCGNNFVVKICKILPAGALRRLARPRD